MTIAHDEAVIDAAAVDAIFAEARTANTFTGEVTDEQARAIYELTKFGPPPSTPSRCASPMSGPPRPAPPWWMPFPTATAPRPPRRRWLPSSAIDTAWQEQWDNFLPGYNAPKAMYDAAPDLAAATGNNNAHLQAGYFILAVRSLGLAAGR